MADLRRVFSDAGRVRAQLETAVSLRLRSEVGLPLVLYESMAGIAEIDCCRVQDLAAGLGVSAGAASKLVDRLCALGYCRRLPNPGDGRSSVLQLTPAGRQKLAAAGRSVDHELERLLRPVLSAGQVRDLAATLRDLRSAGPRLPPSRPDRASRLLGPPPGF